jgi:7-cyano-7-deazaguanine reductase
MSDNPLGRETSYPTHYDPAVLYPIPRWPSRSLLDIDKKIPLYGFDFWRAYELSWLNEKGRPEVGIGEIYVDAKSDNIVESKSLKLYLNSLNNETFKSRRSLAAVISRDLTAVTRSEVTVVIRELGEESLYTLDQLKATRLDMLDIPVNASQPAPELLVTVAENVTRERLCSDLFRSNCPITGQPDWASVLIEYSGQRIVPAALLAYICSFRSHQGYHEECAELMFRDIMVRCQPRHLIIGLQFTRRGGLEINPFRSNDQISPEQLQFRLVRQ